MTKTFFAKLKDMALILMLFFPVISLAQQSISGTITDADTGEPLLGVTVLVQGTNKGTVSDFDGNYLIQNVDSGEYVLDISYTGYSKQSQAVSVGSSDLSQDLQLTFSASELDEIVVTGTGAPVAKKQLGNSIGSISAASLEQLPINSFSDILAGREPGIVAFPS
ncbi:MAG: hypothetical protein CMC00_03775, partial [Flavobacteriaceae bacterium]|nr:hypothetical protein [Flavobacteriaceae bacterium]